MNSLAPLSLALALFVLLPSCTTPGTTAATGAPLPSGTPGAASQLPPSGSGVSPMGAYRTAQQAASAINTARTLGSLF